MKCVSSLKDHNSRNYLSMYYLKNAQLFPGYHETPSLHQVYWHNHHQQERNEYGVYLNFLLRFYCSYWRCYWTSHKLLYFLHSQAVYGCIYYPKERSLCTRFCQQNILWYSHLFRVLLTMSLLLLWSVQLEEDVSLLQLIVYKLHKFSNLNIFDSGLEFFVNLYSKWCNLFRRYLIFFRQIRFSIIFLAVIQEDICNQIFLCLPLPKNSFGVFIPYF